MTRAGCDATRVWSWCATAEQIAERRGHAEGLAGQRIQSVRYFTLDYLRGHFHPELTDTGSRLIADQPEWDDPTWRFDGFDAFDYGLELLTGSGTVWSLTWDPPGDREGIGLRNQPMIGSGVAAEGHVAVWDVTGTTAWSPLVEEPIESVELHYEAWDGGCSGFWCPHISLVSQSSRLEIIMGDSDHGALVPSADNVAVLWPGTPLPDWLARNH